MFNKKQKKKRITQDAEGRFIIDDTVRESPLWKLLIIPYAPLLVPSWVYGAVFLITFAVQSLALQDLTLLSKINSGDLGPEYLAQLNLHITNYQQLANFGMIVWSVMIASAILGILTWLGRTDSN